MGRRDSLVRATDQLFERDRTPWPERAICRGSAERLTHSTGSCQGTSANLRKVDTIGCLTSPPICRDGGDGTPQEQSPSSGLALAILPNSGSSKASHARLGGPRWPTAAWEQNEGSGRSSGTAWEQNGT